MILYNKKCGNKNINNNKNNNINNNNNIQANKIDDIITFAMHHGSILLSPLITITSAVGVALLLYRTKENPENIMGVALLLVKQRKFHRD